jgi:2-hydroxychromene-2-carboxylate isomerase
VSSVAFYFDYRSSYSYLADSQVSTLGVPIEYRPVDLVVVLQLTNNPARTSASRAKFRYGNVDGLRGAKRYGIGFGLNDKIRSISSELLSCGSRQLIKTLSRVAALLKATIGCKHRAKVCRGFFEAETTECVFALRQPQGSSRIANTTRSQVLYAEHT